MASEDKKRVTISEEHNTFRTCIGTSSFDIDDEDISDTSIINTLSAEMSNEKYLESIHEEMAKIKVLEEELEKLQSGNAIKGKLIDFENLAFNDLSSAIDVQAKFFEKYAAFINETTDVSTSCSEDLELCTARDQQMNMDLKAYKHNFEAGSQLFSQQVEEFENSLKIQEESMENLRKSEEAELDFLRKKIANCKKVEASYDVEISRAQNEKETMLANVNSIERYIKECTEDIEQNIRSGNKICKDMDTDKDIYQTKIADTLNRIQDTNQRQIKLEENIGENKKSLEYSKEKQLKLEAELSTYIKIKNDAIEKSCFEHNERIKGLNLICEKSEKNNFDLNLAFSKLQDCQKELVDAAVSTKSLRMELEAAQEKLLNEENVLKDAKTKNYDIEKMQEEKKNLIISNKNKTEEINQNIEELCKLENEIDGKIKSAEQLKCDELGKIAELLDAGQKIKILMVHEHENEIRKKRQEFEEFKINSAIEAEESSNQQSADIKSRKDEHNKLKKMQSDTEGRINVEHANLTSVMLEYDVLMRKINETQAEIDAQNAKIAETKKEMDKLILPPLPKPMSRKREMDEESDSSIEGTSLAEHLRSMKARREMKKMAKGAAKKSK